MRRFFGGFSTFPSGPPGLGLALLRVVLALGVIVNGAQQLAGALTEPAGADAAIGSLLGLLRIGYGTLIASGIRTTFVTAVHALVGTGGFATDMWTMGSAVLAADRYGEFLEIAIAVSLLLLGPGAYSVDARLFGHREIVIPQRASSPSGHETQDEIGTKKW